MRALIQANDNDPRGLVVEVAERLDAPGVWTVEAVDEGSEGEVYQSKARFYKYPWFYHFKHGVSKKLRGADRLLVTTASIGTKKERQTYTASLEDVVKQSASHVLWAVDFRPAMADPCLQAADYCAWAIQRKWERSDERALDVIRDKLDYEYELWRHGTVHYY